MASPWLCPEIRLHLVTEQCPLWRAGEDDLERMGLPSPFWAFCWAGGEALARTLLDHPERVAGRRVLDFGAGGGVEAVAAARAGARVVAVDVDPLAAHCVRLNAERNGVQVAAVVADWLGRADLDFDTVLVGDVTYDALLARRVVDWLSVLADRGTEVWIADPGRGCLPPEATDRLRPVATHRAPADNDQGQRSFVTATVYRLEPLFPTGLIKSPPQTDDENAIGPAPGGSR